MKVPEADTAHGSPRPVWLALALVAALAIAYLPVFSAGFVWDDDGHLTPPHLRGVGGLARIWIEPDSTQQYYPLLHTLFWIEHQLFGAAPLPYHAANLLLHAAAALLLVRLLQRLAIPGAWLAGALFALHPLQVESVAWISEQKNTLMACAYFGAWLAWTRFDAARERGERNPGAWAASFLLALAAVLSKTVACTLVPAILLLTWWREGGTAWTRRIPWLAPHLLCMGALALATPWLEKHVGGAARSGEELDLGSRLLVAGQDLWFYLGKLAWPFEPCFVYPRWNVASPAAWTWIAPLAFAGLLGVLFALRTRLGRGPFTALAFFAGTLAPALGFFDAIPFRYSFVADHFQYLAGLGPIVLVAAAASARSARATAAVRPALLAAGAVVLGAYALTTHFHARDFRDAETLWRATVKRNPGAWMAWANLVDVLNRQGRFEEALAPPRRAARTIRRAHTSTRTPASPCRTWGTPTKPWPCSRRRSAASPAPPRRI